MNPSIRSVKRLDQQNYFQTAKAIDFFMQMFDEDFMQHIVAQTNLYALEREDWEYLTLPEFQSFLGTVMLDGYI